jgi:cell filamentation protein
MSKISIRFFNDREVRAVWDDDHNKWWFSATDIVRAIRSSSAGLLPEGRKNDEDDYVKAGNYWRWLKKKFNTEGIQLVSVTHDFKFQAPDGKQRFADALDAECVQTVANNYPNNRARKFLEWFTYSDTTIDGQSQKKAYTLFESGLMETLKPGTVKALQQIHAYLFGGLYDFAGKIRTKTISKGNTLFCLAEHLHNYLKTVEAMPENTFEEIIDKYVEMNAAHPFMEGNGRSTRIWLDLILKKRLGLCVDWSKVGKKEYLNAMIESQTDSTHIKQLLKQALTDKINDRETFMKGIDYSYYYEQAD